MNDRPLEVRVIELESLVTHLEHGLDQLNGVLVEQRQELDALRADLTRVQNRLASASDDAGERTNDS